MAFSDIRGFLCLTSVKEILDIINRQDAMYNTIAQYFLDNNSRNLVSECIKQMLEATDIEVDGMMH